MGKRKIEIERIENRDKRYVTFSKRRKGLFKKAAAACNLYGSEIAIIVFSPVGKLYSFGHESVDSVIDRFLINNKFNGNQQQRHSSFTRTIKEEKDDDQVVLHDMMMKPEEENSHHDSDDDQKNHKKKDEDEVITTEEMINLSSTTTTTTNLYLRDGDGYSWPSLEDWKSIDYFTHPTL